ncbi:hypothetical protein WAI453_004018 [Rhynchosporium graminicola]
MSETSPTHLSLRQRINSINNLVLGQKSLKPAAKTKCPHHRFYNPPLLSFSSSPSTTAANSARVLILCLPSSELLRRGLEKEGRKGGRPTSSILLLARSGYLAFTELHADSRHQHLGQDISLSTYLSTKESLPSYLGTETATQSSLSSPHPPKI